MYDYDPMNPTTFLHPGVRKPNPDGTVTIICYICEKPIVKQMYRGFSTAICAVCAGFVEQGLTPEQVIARVAQEEKNERHEVYNDLGNQKFRAVSPWQRIKEVIETVKVAAQKRKRPPIFSGKDKEPQ